MSMRAVVLGAMLVAVACVGSARPKSEPVAPPSSLELGGVRAFIVQRHEPALTHAIPGDFALEGPLLSIEVAGRGHADRRGALVAVRQGHISHDWESMLPWIAFEGVEHAVEIERIRLVRDGARPAIVMLGRVQADETTLGVKRVLRLSEVEGVLQVSTSVALDAGALPRALRIVERVRWGGGTPVAPLQAPLEHATLVSTEWLGRATDRRAIAIGARSGPVRVVGSEANHGQSDVLLFTDVELPTQPLANGRWHAEALLSASPAGLADAVRRLGWARGHAFPEAVVMLATDPPGAEVRVVDAESGVFVASGNPDEQRRVILPLPEAAAGKALVVVALAHGREASPRAMLSGPPYAPLLLAIPEGSTLEVVATHAASSEPIPVRIRILPARGAADPNLGPDWAARGAIDTVIAPSGKATLPLPSGFYRVIVTHGPEWSIEDRELALDVGATTRLHAQLEHVVDPGPWLACELHVHAAPSHDSQVSLADRVASLVAEGIELVVPSDHNYVTDYSSAIQAQPLEGLATIAGVEVTTTQPNIGHFNAFPYPIDLNQPGNGAPEFRGLTPASLFASLRAVSPELVIQVNHPRLEGGIGYFELTQYDPIAGTTGPSYSDDYDSLEVWNGFDLARPENVDRLFHDWLAILARGKHLVATGSSDSHTIRSQAAGYPRTYVRAPLSRTRDPRAVIHALKQGHAFVSSGPFLNVQVQGRGPGDEVTITGDEAELEIAIQTAAWMELSSLRVYLGQDLVYRAPLEKPDSSRFGGLGLRYAQTIHLPLEHSAPLVVAVEGDKPIDSVVARRGMRPFAFTNPIWLVKAEATEPSKR